ncbi:dehydrase and lipid transport-domain-containing protein [Lineolata rhizophorae]|uniref:Dehydrase and lipid transport-domain-containing protein n=1 Tax=Lineolata rhizophorae TaxID=578093 RepID=A0A6A6NTC5_9PEZI|nr:dehydrase and lipid transport-domain-containing protein [Lineolata rhizophorae]
MSSKPPSLHPHRTFLPNPFASSTSTEPNGSIPLQSISATRTLPYPREQLYEIIADVNAYSSYLPYCRCSEVTAWTTMLPTSTSTTTSHNDGQQSQHGRRYPAEAILEVGWSAFTERFTSRIVCEPGVAVSAVAGKDAAEFGGAAADTSLLIRCRTKWKFEDVPSARGAEEDANTDVSLALDFVLANPMYAAMSAAVAPKVAGIMIEAFERRARELLGERGRRR